MSKQIPEINWQTKTIEPLGLKLDLLAEVEISEGGFEDTTYLIQSSEPLLLGVWYGAQQDLASFRAGFGPHEPVRFGPEEARWLCGQRALRQVGTVAEGTSSVGLVQASDDSLGHLYSSSKGVTHIAVALRLGAHKVLIKWQVATAERATYQAAEAHFFQAITCRQ